MVLPPWVRSPGEHEVDARPDQALVVEAGVLEEAVVLGGEHRLHEHLRDVRIAHRDPAELAELRNETPVTGIDPERHLQGDVLHAFDRGEARGQEIPGASARGPQSDQEGQRDAEQP